MIEILKGIEMIISGSASDIPDRFKYYKKYDHDKTGEEIDAESLEEDWDRIGEDFRKTIKF